MKEISIKRFSIGFFNTLGDEWCISKEFNFIPSFCLVMRTNICIQLILRWFFIAITFNFFTMKSSHCPSKDHKDYRESFIHERPDPETDAPSKRKGESNVRKI
jgi:hypothetical protein